MIDIQHNISLKPYNTFGIEAMAKDFCIVNSLEEIKALMALDCFQQKKLWLGGGSNMLLTQNFDGLVIKLNLKGKAIIGEDVQKVLVSACAGENWHEFVLWTISLNLGGLENLSLIPGNVGTTPIQNIGAYGVEMKDTFHKLEALNIENGTIEIFDKKACAFAYRESIFKKEFKGKYIVTKVFFELTKEAFYIPNTSYGAIEQELEKQGLDKTIANISKAVIQIRESKLPNPKEIGNSGSFFKNPIVSKAFYDDLKKQYSEVVAYPLKDNTVKLAAGWLIENAGWKGYRKGDAGVHKKQALVLVNYNTATGKELDDLAHAIESSIFRKFGVSLEREVNII